MDTSETLENKADRTLTRAIAADCSAVTAGLYTILSIPNPATDPQTPYGVTLNWGVEAVHTANQAISHFLENAASIHISDHVIGAGIGLCAAVAFSLYGKAQRRKTKKFLSQADEINGKNGASIGQATEKPTFE